MPLYDAFISYSHAKDKPIASALQSVIQKLGMPWYRRRALRVFRDDTSLSATPQLWPSIEHGLSQSRFLILLASPEAAASEWVSKELAYWVEHKSVDTLLIALTGGDLRWSDRAGDFTRYPDTPLPPVLVGRFAAEPRWVDLRSYRDGANPRNAHFIEAAADFAATIHGIPKEDLLSQEVRQQRRTLTMAWSAAVTLFLLTGAAAWQWWEADRAKEIVIRKTNEALNESWAAQRNLRVANDAAERIVQRLVQNLRHLTGMRPEVSLQVLDSLQTMLDELDQESPDNPMLQRTRGMILHQFAATYRGMREFAKAREAAEQAVAMARALATKFPDDRGLGGVLLPINRFHRDLTVQLDMLGDVCLEAGEQACATAAYEESLAGRRKLIVIAPDYDELQRDLSVALSNLGHVRGTAADLDGSLALYTEALGIDRKRAEADPADNSRQRDLGYTLLRLGDLQRNMGDKAAAVSSYEESLAMRRKLAADESNAQAQYELSIVLGGLGDLRFDPLNSSDAQIRQALHHYLESESITRKLLASDPSRAQWRRDLTAILFRIGDARGELRELEAARAAYDEGLVLRRKLAAEDPENRDRQHDLAAAIRTFATFRLTTGSKADWPEVLALYEEDVAILRGLVARDQDSAKLQRELASGLSSVGDLKVELGDSNAALAAYNEGAAILYKLVAADPRDLDVKSDLLFRLYYNVLKLGNAAEPEWARASLNEALTVAAELACKGRLQDYDPRASIREQLAKLPPSQIVGEPQDVATSAGEDRDPCTASPGEEVGSVDGRPEQTEAR